MDLLPSMSEAYAPFFLLVHHVVVLFSYDQVDYLSICLTCSSVRLPLSAAVASIWVARRHYDPTATCRVGSVTCLQNKKPSWQKTRILHLSTQLEDSMFNSKTSLVSNLSLAAVSFLVFFGRYT